MSFQELLAMRAKKLGGKFSNPEAKGLRTEGGGEELSKEDVHVDTCHVIYASCHLLPQEGVAVGHQNVQQNSQKMDDQVLREDRFLIQPPSRVYLFQG